MENKNSMSRVERLHREKVTRYSIRKYSFGAASVAVAALFMFLGNGAVSADMTAVQPQDESGLKAERPDENAELPQVEKEVVQPAESTPAAQPIAEEPTAKPAEPATPALDKKQLESYIKEIEAKLANGSYANKTDESVAVLKAELETAKTTLVNATSQDELTKAYNKLVTTANTKLKNKPVEKKETPAVDTTNGKETVGKTAENTEKKSESNSIENTGSNDPRNGKEMDKDNALRTETSKTVDNITYTTEFSNDATKEIYVYNKEEANVEFKINSSTNKVTYVETTGGSNQKFTTVNDTTVTDGYGYNFDKITTETDTPLTVRMIGQPNATIMGNKNYTKTEAQNFAMGERYLRVTAKDGSTMSPAGNGLTQPGYFKIVLKSQTYKYSIQEPALDGDKIGVDDINNLTATEIAKIKEKINIQYSDTATKQDARLASHKGEVLADKYSVVKDIAIANGTVTVTYNDDSVDTTPISNIARTNVAPTVSIPYSDPTPNKKEVYLYTGEEADVDITFNDDSGKIKSAALKKGGNIALNNVGGNPDLQDNEWGFTVTAINSETATPAKIKVTGQVSGIAENKLPKTENDSLELVTRFATATDKDGKEINNIAVKNKNNGEVVGSYLTDPGAVTFVLKAQAKKYDIVTPTEEDKVAVADPTAVTDEEFAKIKAKLEYSRTNEDKNLESKRGEAVDNTDNKVATITKEGNNIVATYKDGSKDIRPLTDFTKLDKQPAIDAVNTAATEKIAAINSTSNATDEEKQVAIDKVNADKTAALTAINGATTKTALDTAKDAGTTAIAADNPVVAKKAAAKADVEAARKAKEDAIKANPNLTQAEKDAAIAKNNTAAAEATKAIDAATTNDAVDTAKTAGTTEIGKVNPVAKENAKEAIGNALTAKNQEIDNRTDLSDAEKKAAKDEAQKLADAELAKINAQPDNAETPEKATEAQTAVDAAKDKGVADVKAVNPVAKEEAKKAIAKELEDKNSEIDKRTDLTDEEKTAAKAEAKKLADAELAKINAQPDNADTPEKAAEAQKAVDAAKDKGVADVKAVNPEAAKKTEAKQAIDDALATKNKEIDERTDLTPEEKTKAKEAAKAQADVAKAAVDNATTNAAVDKAKADGTTAVANVTPVAKAEAKKAINDALTAKNKEIDARTDLTDEEKTAAKNEAKDKADAQLAEIAKQPDAAATPEAAQTAQAAVDAAKKTGVDEVTAVNPVAVKKTEAKQAIDDALTAKNNAIDARTDLTDAEKKVAKDKAAEEAKKAKEAIDSATTDVAVDTAKTSGLGEVAKVNPVAKEAAKKAVADELARKEAEIDARTDLTDAEKAKAKKEAQDKAKEATDAINVQPDNADTPEKATEAQKTVDAAKDKGVADVKAVNPVAKEEAKKAIADELAKKEAEIDARTDLTQEEKDAAKKEAQDKAKAATDAINAQPDNADTPEKATEAQKAVDAAKKSGVDEVKAVNPEAKAKPAAKKAIEDKLAKQLEDIANTPDATDDEKKVAADAAKALAEGAKKEIDKAGTDAEVKQLQEEAEGEIEKSVPVVEDKPNARKAIEDEAKAKKEAIDARTDLTPKAKEDLKAQVDAIADQAKKSVDAAKTSEAVDGIEESDKAAIKAVGEVNIPADKVLVNNPSALTDDEKAKVLEAVKKVNPDAKEITQDADGNVTVTTPDGHKEIITPEQVVKTAATANDPKAGNDIVKPADKVVVNDPAKLTDAEKEKIKAAVEAVNPNSIVVVDDKGNAKVSTPDGQTQVIPVEELVRTVEDTKKPNAGNDIVKPADKTVVANPDALTPEEKKAIEDKVKAVNPGATVAVDDKGNATVTTPEGKTAVIPAADLTKDPEAATKPNAGNDIVKPADKTVVANPEKLTDAEKKAIEDKVKAVNPDATVVVDDKGNATVTTPEGKTAVIPASDLTKDPEAATKPNAGNDIVKPADKTVVANPEKLTDAEKKAIEDKVKAVNPDATVVVDDKGNATVTTPEGKTAVIPAADLTKDPAAATKPNAGNDIVKPADKTVVADPEKLTDAEKKAIEDKVKAVNPGATVAVDDKGNATVTTPEGKTAVIPAADLTKDPAAATKANAGNDIVKPADKTVVANPEKLTDAEKKAIEDKVKAVNPDATVVVDDKGNATVTTPEGKTAVIPATDLTKSPEEAAKANAGNDIVKPADKTVVANPEKLTDAEKKAIEDKVKAVNPDATVVVDDKGNATVTTPEGKTAVIPAADLTKDPAAATKPNAGNDIVKPADKTVVADPEKLTDAEKKAIEDKVKAVNPGATVVVDDKGNATVTTPEGKTAVIPAADLTKDPEAATKPNAGNAVNTPASKVEVKDPANLTDEEKAKVKKAIEAVNPGSKVVVDDKGNATVTTPEGNTAVIPAADVTKSAADAGKANAGNAVNTPASKVEVKDPANLTPEEKKAIEDKVKAVNPDATVVVDDKGNATVTTPEGKTAVIPATDLTKDPEAATKPNAGNAVNTPASKVEVKDPANLTDEEKAKVKKAIEAVNPGSKVVVDDKGNATVTTPEGNTAVIPAADVTKSAADAGKANAGNAVNTPASKVEVKDPANLTDAEKKAIEDKVKAVNPGSKVVVDDKGNATVTTPEGKTATIPATDLTKSASDAGKENAGNGANTPATKTVVKDPANLTDEEKAKVKKAVEDVNPGSTVVVNDKGDVIVTKGDGTVLVIPELDLVIPEDKLTDPTQQNGVNTPATRVLVGDKAKLTADEIEKVKESIKAVNPGSTVVVDDKGNATVTTPEGKTATIPAAQLVKDAKDVAAKNNGENINVDFEKETVADFNNLTDAEKEAAKAKIKGANADVVEVIFDKAGNATVITKDGKVYTIVAKDIFKQRPYVPSNGGDNNSGNGNGATNTDAKVDKAKLEGAIHQLDELIIKESAKLDAETAKEANALSADAKKVFANADASQAEVDAMVKRIEDFMAKVASSTDHAAPANDQAAQTSAVAPATAQAAANAGQTASAQANARKAAKELPNTGTADSTVAMVAAAASAVLGLGLAGRRRKEDEEA